MGANTNDMTCPVHMRRAGFFPVAPDFAGVVVHSAMTDTKVFLKGELVIDDASGGATNPSTTIDLAVWKGICDAPAGDSGAGNNDNLEVPVLVPAFGGTFFWAEAVSQPSGSHNAVYTFSDKNTVNIGSGATEGDVGFKVYGFDAATTYYAIFGCFVVMGA